VPCELVTGAKKSYDTASTGCAPPSNAPSAVSRLEILKTGYHRIVTDFSGVLRTVTGFEIFRACAPRLE